MRTAAEWVKAINEIPEESNPLSEFDELWDTILVGPEEISGGRWTRYVRYVCKAADESLFAFEIEEGLTEYQDAEPNADAYLVKAMSVVVTRYERAESGDVK